ncbi:xanthine dehydrogenase small subunit [Motiliproteus sp. MSK22-1]|uniref:xanthine dehydrogenase small subunit n=1 Tax=Motiliproteus sp. MSK22-1 TaxID=1897630 RepID=UPI000975AC00|nr:xanthine dehydrogenase small subunit [Motiliproteus sp. MSK22-1]OMH39799.1 xanthine dehydrogenase small subunit [Motiliproteus sp. MSK22-1]
MIRFLLNRELKEEQDIDPNMTVLNYLRNHAAKPGTKEGCASGDCGACTVVLAELKESSPTPTLEYKSINSCLTFVSALQGKQLITVEDLKHQNKLHPAQQSMVDCHGSQCGFCTPGFVMSMFALGKNIGTPEKEDIQEALAGNLCRCTGYRPIIDAANAMFDDSLYSDAASDKFDRDEQKTITDLQRIREYQINESASLNQGNKSSFNPRNIDELADLYVQYPHARLLAGGTDLALEVTQMHRELEILIYLGDIDELKQINVDSKQIELGAAASLTRCYESLCGDYPDFGELLHRFASLQIRNQGTLGGNIGNASPIGDSPPALIALGAQIVLRKGTETRTLKLEDYFIDYKVTAQQESEFIEKVILPRAAQNGEFRSYKISKRLDDDISAVLACFNITIKQGQVKDAIIAFGGMAAIPKRANLCEQALIGKEWNQKTLEQAVAALKEDFAPIDDFRATKEYRMLTAQNLLRRYFIEIESPEVETRVTAYV